MLHRVFVISWGIEELQKFNVSVHLFVVIFVNETKMRLFPAALCQIEAQMQIVGLSYTPIRKKMKNLMALE